LGIQGLKGLFERLNRLGVVWGGLAWGRLSQGLRRLPERLVCLCQ
jgi:hypothetical protein